MIDNYFTGHTKDKRSYLVEEYNFVKRYIKGRFSGTLPILDIALDNTSSKVFKYITRPKIATCELIRQGCITEVMRNFLIAWSKNDENVLRVDFEELCIHPVKKTKEA